MKPLDPKDEEIARLKAQVTELQRELIQYMNYSLQLDRELQTGETNVSDANHHTDPTSQRS
jgi:hypothetical protein